MRRRIVAAVVVVVIVLLLAVPLLQQLRRAGVARQVRLTLIDPLSQLDLPPAYLLGRKLDNIDPARLRQVAQASEKAGDLRTAGIALGAVGDYPAAQRALEDAAAANPRDLFAGLALGNVLDAQGDSAAAEARWQPIDAQRALAIQLHRAGSAIANGGDRERAKTFMELAMAIDPANPNPPYTLAGYYWPEDRGRAVELYRAALAIGGLEPFFQYAAEGRVALEDGDLEAAVAGFKSALDLRSNHGETLSLLASTLDRLGRPDEALEYFRKAADASPDPFRSLVDMGQIFIEQGQYLDAVQVLGEAVRLRADRPNVFALLAQAYNGAGQAEQSRLAWQQAITLSPDNAFYRIQLGDVLATLGDTTGAIDAYRAGLDRNPDSDYARRQLRALGVEP